jgi:hypothetical protein
VGTEDYAWFTERFPGLAQAYCLTLVGGLTPEQSLARLPAYDLVELIGLDAVEEMAGQQWLRYEQSRRLDLLVAATAVDGWTLIVEPNGFVGVTEELILALSEGIRVVSHYRNVNAVSRFCWADDGHLRLSFDPLLPHLRTGDVTRAAGLDPSAFDESPQEAAFALAESLTGVVLTADLLEHATYLCGSVPVP